MSVVVCRSLAAALPVEKRGLRSTLNMTWFCNKDAVEHQEATGPYVHPIMRRSSGLMSQTSLEMCTESLGSESGSDHFSSDDERVLFASSEVRNARKQQGSVDRRSSSHHPRSFPPPIASLSMPRLSMRPHRSDGRLVMEAVPLPSHNYLHARRHNGRLLLAFVDSQPGPKPVEPVLEVEDEEEEEVEVVDRGAVVEVKVSTQPQQQRGAMRVWRSSLVINKFVSGAPMNNQNRLEDSRTPSQPQRRSAGKTTTAAAAAVEGSSASSEAAAPSSEKKLMFTSKRRNREEMLHHMRRCSELRRPLFIWEPCCIATS